VPVTVFLSDIRWFFSLLPEENLFQLFMVMCCVLRGLMCSPDCRLESWQLIILLLAACLGWWHANLI
jgi:hypothetical protein